MMPFIGFTGMKRRGITHQNVLHSNEKGSSDICLQCGLLVWQEAQLTDPDGSILVPSRHKNLDAILIPGRKGDYRGNWAE